MEPELGAGILRDGTQDCSAVLLSYDNDHEDRGARPPKTAMSNVTPRVIATEAAIQLIDRLKTMHGPLMFHQSGGCCDGSAPMCWPRGEYRTGASDVRLGEIGDCPFWMSESQFEYWQHTQLIIDVVPGRGGMFSLEGPEGMRFLTRSRLFTDEEWASVSPVEHGGD